MGINKSLKPLSLFFIGVTTAAIAPAAMSQDSRRIDPVYVKTSQSEGNGIRFRTGDKCIIVTAFHILKDGAVPTVTGTYGNAAAVREFEADSARDTALLVQEVDDASKCGTVDELDNITRAVSNNETGQLRWVTAGGDVLRVPVKLLRENNDASLTLAIMETDAAEGMPKRLEPGMSGSVVVLGGVPVAIAQSESTTNATFRAHRLDDIFSAHSKNLT